MAFSVAAKNEMLDGVTVDLMSLHTDDPGSSGTSNEVSGGGYSRQAATFAAASSGERALDDDVDFVGPADEDATWIGLWEDGDPDVFKGRVALSGDVAFNSSGEFQVKAATTKLTLSDS